MDAGGARTDVIAVVGDVGQEHDGLEKIHDKALRTGAIECRVVDMREEFAKEYLTPALAANALYENKYPLVSALSRPLIAKHLVEIAHEFGARSTWRTAAPARATTRCASRRPS